MENVKKSWPNTLVVWLFILSVIVVGAACFYRYFYTKNYDVRVEASCNPELEDCSYRDCTTDPSECPPNGLAIYKVYTIKAYDFEKCIDNSCKNECESSQIQCEQIACDESEGDICSPIETE